MIKCKYNLHIYLLPSNSFGFFGLTNIANGTKTKHSKSPNEKFIMETAIKTVPNSIRPKICRTYGKNCIIQYSIDISLNLHFKNIKKTYL